MARLDIDVNDNNDDNSKRDEYLSREGIGDLFGTELPDVDRIGGNPVNDYKIRSLERKVDAAFDKLTRNLSVVTKTMQDRLRKVTEPKQLEQLIVDTQEKQLLSLDNMVRNVNDHIDKLRSQFQASADRAEDPTEYQFYLDQVDSIANSFEKKFASSEQMIQQSITTLMEPNEQDQAKEATRQIMSSGAYDRFAKVNELATAQQDKLNKLIESFKTRAEKVYGSASDVGTGDKRAKELANSFADQIEEVVDSIAKESSEVAKQAFGSKNPYVGQLAKHLEKTIKQFGDDLFEEFIDYSVDLRKDAIQSINLSDLEKFGNQSAREIERGDATKAREEKLRQAQIEREALKVDFENPQDNYTDSNRGQFGAAQLNKAAAAKKKEDEDFSGDAKKAATRNAELEKHRTKLYQDFLKKQNELAERMAKEVVNKPTGNKYLDMVLGASEKYAPYSHYSHAQREREKQEKDQIFSKLVAGVTRENVHQQYGQSLWDMTQQYAKTGQFNTGPMVPPIVNFQGSPMPPTPPPVGQGQGNRAQRNAQQSAGAPPTGGNGGGGGWNFGNFGGGMFNNPNPMPLPQMFQIGEILDDFSYKLKAAANAIEEWLTQPILEFRQALIAGSKFEARPAQALSAIGTFAENSQTMAGGAFGAAAGAIVGGMVGGPAGALVGGSFGGSVGSALADLLPSWIQIASESLAMLDEIAANTAQSSRAFSGDLLSATIDRQMTMLEQNISRGDAVGSQLADIYQSQTQFNLELARLGDRLINAFGPLLELVTDSITGLLKGVNFLVDVAGKVLEYFAAVVPGLQAALDLYKSSKRRKIGNISSQLNEFFRSKGV
jgi:hypothetical protein